MNTKSRVVAILIASLATFQTLGYTANPNESFPPVNESKAFELFKQRPHTDFSKLLYLIDRFENSGIEIVYEGHYYKALFAARLARWFMVRNYRKESPTEWIMRWCNTSMGGKLIYVKFPNGKFRLSREVLMEELRVLDAALANEQMMVAAVQEKKAPEAPPELNLVPVASKLMSPEAATASSPAPAMEAPQH